MQKKLRAKDDQKSSLRIKPKFLQGLNTWYFCLIFSLIFCVDVDYKYFKFVNVTVHLPIGGCSPAFPSNSAHTVPVQATKCNCCNSCQT